MDEEEPMNEEDTTAAYSSYSSEPITDERIDEIYTIMSPVYEQYSELTIGQWNAYSEAEKQAVYQDFVEMSEAFGLSPLP
jgi:thiaminase